MVSKYIKQLLKESSQKFLIFAHHRNMVDAICGALDETDTHYMCIVGSTPPRIRAVSRCYSISIHAIIRDLVTAYRPCKLTIRVIVAKIKDLPSNTVKIPTP